MSSRSETDLRERGICGHCDLCGMNFNQISTYVEHFGIHKERNDKFIKKAEKISVKEAEKDAIKEAEKDAVKEAEKIAEKEAEKGTEKDAEKEAEKDAVKEADKVAEKEAQKGAVKEADKDAEKEADKDAEKEAEKDAEKEAEKDAENEAEKNAEKEVAKDFEKEAEKIDTKKLKPKGGFNCKRAYVKKKLRRKRNELVPREDRSHDLLTHVIGDEHLDTGIQLKKRKKTKISQINSQQSTPFLSSSQPNSPKIDDTSLEVHSIELRSGKKIQIFQNNRESKIFREEKVLSLHPYNQEKVETLRNESSCKNNVATLGLGNNDACRLSHSDNNVRYGIIFTCNVCQERFSSEPEYKKHSQIHIRDNNSPKIIMKFKKINSNLEDHGHIHKKKRLNSIDKKKMLSDLQSEADNKKSVKYSKTRFKRKKHSRGSSSRKAIKNLENRIDYDISNLPVKPSIFEGKAISDEKPTTDYVNTDNPNLTTKSTNTEKDEMNSDKPNWLLSPSQIKKEIKKCSEYDSDSSSLDFCINEKVDYSNDNISDGEDSSDLNQTIENTTDKKDSSSDENKTYANEGRSNTSIPEDLIITNIDYPKNSVEINVNNSRKEAEEDSFSYDFFPDDSSDILEEQKILLYHLEKYNDIERMDKKMLDRIRIPPGFENAKELTVFKDSANVNNTLSVSMREKKSNERSLSESIGNHSINSTKNNTSNSLISINSKLTDLENMSPKEHFETKHSSLDKSEEVTASEEKFTIEDHANQKRKETVTDNSLIFYIKLFKDKDNYEKFMSAVDSRYKDKQSIDLKDDLNFWNSITSMKVPENGTQNNLNCSETINSIHSKAKFMDKRQYNNKTNLSYSHSSMENNSQTPMELYIPTLKRMEIKESSETENIHTSYLSEADSIVSKENNNSIVQIELSRSIKETNENLKSTLSSTLSSNTQNEQNNGVVIPNKSLSIMKKNANVSIDPCMPILEPVENMLNDNFNKFKKRKKEKRNSSNFQSHNTSAEYQASNNPKYNVDFNPPGSGTTQCILNAGQKSTFSTKTKKEIKINILNATGHKVASKTGNKSQRKINSEISDCELPITSTATEMAVSSNNTECQSNNFTDTPSIDESRSKINLEISASELPDTSNASQMKAPSTDTECQNKSYTDTEIKSDIKSVIPEDSTPIEASYFDYRFIRWLRKNFGCSQNENYDENAALLIITKWFPRFHYEYIRYMKRLELPSKSIHRRLGLESSQPTRIEDTDDDCVFIKSTNLCKLCRIPCQYESRIYHTEHLPLHRSGAIPTVLHLTPNEQVWLTHKHKHFPDGSEYVD